MANGKTVKSVDKKVTCPTCNKTLARKYSLDRHIARFHAAVQESIVGGGGGGQPHFTSFGQPKKAKLG